VDQIGALANIKRHDYLPFGEELFGGTGSRSPSQGYSLGDSIRQQFTSKERDIETGLDYFGARYYSGNQGRFTGMDSYDVNIERQRTTNQEEMDTLFREYIGQPQNWNRYSYALNNPLKYVDPNGLSAEENDLEYKRTLLGKTITIKFSPKIDEETRNKILDNIDQSINRINNPVNGQLTEEEKKVITSLNGITVTPDIAWDHTINKVFMIRPQLGLTENNDWLTAAIIHDSYHAYTGSGGVEEEKKASSFAIGPARKIGLGDTTIQNLCMDAKFGHKPPSNNPYKLKKKSK